MAYQTFRVEITRDETRDGGPVMARGLEQPAAIHRRFRYAGGGACRDYERLSGGRPHPMLRVFRRQRISGRGGAAPAIRREMAARRLVPAVTSAAEVPA